MYVTGEQADKCVCVEGGGGGGILQGKDQNYFVCHSSSSYDLTLHE